MPPERPAYDGPSGWVGLDLSVEPLDWDLVRDLVTESYRATAPRRLVARLDSMTQAPGDDPVSRETPPSAPR